MTTEDDKHYHQYDPSISVCDLPDETFDVGDRWLGKPDDECSLVKASIDDAHLITSRADIFDNDDDGGFSLPVIDLDFPCRLIPSSTPGHFHLYMDRLIDTDAYWNVLEAMVDAGLVEPGYLKASMARGYTAARLPWVKKATTTRKAESV